MRIIYRTIKTIVLKIRARLTLKKMGKPKVKKSIETVNFILNHQDYSVARFGDGEFDLINGNSIKFQKYNKELSEKLKQILANNNQKLIVCIPEIYNFETLSKLKYKSKIFWLSYIVSNHKKYVKYLDLNSQYYDACFTRPYIRYDKKKCFDSAGLISSIKMMWEDKNILLIEGKYSRLGVGNDLFKNAKSIERILCPNKDAYSKYGKILSAIIHNAKGKLVLLSLGPTATVLASELSELNIRAIDLGHIDLEYEWFLKQVDEKVAIENKEVNELNKQNKIGEMNDRNYNESIIEVIE